MGHTAHGHHCDEFKPETVDRENPEVSYVVAAEKITKSFYKFRRSHNGECAVTSVSADAAACHQRKSKTGCP
jgi:hypothetical protein